ncbi:hypothetical protein Ancab_032494 [Ancistrocladus abbreviatus]
MAEKWITKGLVRIVRKGSYINLWNEAWKEDANLKHKFLRLFRLATDLNYKINDVMKWINRTWRWDFSWRWELLQREDIVVNEPLSWLKDAQLSKDTEDLMEMDA